MLGVELLAMPLRVPMVLAPAVRWQRLVGTSCQGACPACSIELVELLVAITLL